MIQIWGQQKHAVLHSLLSATICPLVPILAHLSVRAEQNVHNC